MKNFMVKTMDNGKVERRYYKTLARAIRYFESCGSAVLYEYRIETLCYEPLQVR